MQTKVVKLDLTDPNAYGEYGLVATGSIQTKLQISTLTPNDMTVPTKIYDDGANFTMQLIKNVCTFMK